MDTLAGYLRKIDDMIWGPWLLGLLLGTGILLMIRMKFMPIRRLGYALRCAFGLEEDGKIGRASCRERV